MGAAQSQFGLPAGVLPAPGAFAVPAAGHVIAKRDAEAEPESEADAEARDGKQLFFAGRAGPVVGPAPVAVGPAPVAVAPLCRVETERQCRDVPVQVPRSIQVPRCVPVPKTHCVPTTK